MQEIYLSHVTFIFALRQSANDRTKLLDRHIFPKLLKTKTLNFLEKIFQSLLDIGKLKIKPHIKESFRQGLLSV